MSVSGTQNVYKWIREKKKEKIDEEKRARKMRAREGICWAKQLRAYKAAKKHSHYDENINIPKNPNRDYFVFDFVHCTPSAYGPCQFKKCVKSEWEKWCVVLRDAVEASHEANDQLNGTWKQKQRSRKIKQCTAHTYTASNTPHPFTGK